MNAKKSENKLSVIMPALNEEKSISNAIQSAFEAFDYFAIEGEIILINDGSTDRTGEFIEQKIKQYPGKVFVIRHDLPRGIGASFWEGVDLSRGNIIVMLPGDNENDPKEALRYFRLLEHVDIVIPFIFNREVRPFFRNMLSFIYRFIINSTFIVNFTYTNGTVIYRKSILKELTSRSEGFFFQTDILVRSVKNGYLFAEVPYKLRTRIAGSSKALTFPSLFKVVKGYLKLVRDYYFKKNTTDQVKNYSGDSQTALRRDNNNTNNL